VTLQTLRRPCHRLTIEELLLQHAHSAVCKSLDRQAWYAAQLEADTITTRTDDGVFFQIVYRDGDDVKRRYALRLGERDAIEAQRRNMRWWNMLAVNAARRKATRAWLEHLLRTIEARELRDEMSAAELCAALEAAATDCARSKRRHARPLAKCRASNAPNDLSVNEHQPRHAAFHEMRANT
jgi:hypothetical protein